MPSSPIEGLAANMARVQPGAEPSREAMEAAVILEIQNTLGHVTTRKIASLIEEIVALRFAVQPVAEAEGLGLETTESSLAMIMWACEHPDDPRDWPMFRRMTTKLARDHARLKAELAYQRKAQAAAQANIQSAWISLAMVRDAIETVGPVGVLPSQEAVLKLHGPEFEHEAGVLVDGVRTIAAREAAARAEERERCRQAISAVPETCIAYYVDSVMRRNEVSYAQKRDYLDAISNLGRSAP